MFPPKTLIDACARGLAAHAAEPLGSSASVDFAELVWSGMPLPPEAIAEAVEAHVVLDHLDHYRADADDEEKQTRSVIRDLYGGNGEGRAWLVENAPSPEPVKAELDADELGRLTERLTKIDARVIEQLTALVKAAALSALRQVGGRAASASQQVAAPVLAELDCDLEEARADMKAAAPYLTYSAVPAPIFAMLDLEDAIAKAVEDLEVSAADLLARAHRDVVAAIAAEADVPRADVEAALAASEEKRSAAVLILLAAFTSWLLFRVRDRQGEVRDLEALLDTLEPPRQLINSVAAISGGAAVVEGAERLNDLVVRDAVGQVLDDAGRAISGTSVSSGWVRQLADSGDGGVFNVDGTDFEIVLEFEWIYGDPGTRFIPYEPHFRLRGQRWRLEDAAATISVGLDIDGESFPDAIANGYNGFFPGDHSGCQCEIRTHYIRARRI